jgi:hypothetical protein
MPPVALRAHYDGEKVVLDEPATLPANASLLVMVLPVEGETSESAWLRAAAASDAYAFLHSPQEDIYSETDGKPLRDEV